MTPEFNLYDTWSSLRIPTSGEWTALRVGTGDVRVGRSSANSAAVIVPVVAAGELLEAYGLRTSHIEYFPKRELVVTDGAVTHRGTYAVLECTAEDNELVRYFLRLCQSVLLNEANLPSDIDTAIRSVFELFRGLGGPGRRSVQGLWAELLLIVHAGDPGYLVRAWHSDPADLHDFVGDGWRLEVKSTTRSLREHEFSLDQLVHDTQHTAVASVLLIADDAGRSVFDLLDAARKRLCNEGTRRRAEIIVAQSLGAAWRDSSDIRFDEQSALASVQVFAAGDIPRVSTPLPPEVRSVRFRADLGTIVSQFACVLDHALVKAMDTGLKP